MITIAITGGIGSGKSTVTEYLQSLGYRVIDADRMSREMTSSGGKAMPYILEHFGSRYINPDGSMNRVAMRELVFSDKNALALLEEGTTKIVIADIEKIKKEAKLQGEKLLFFDIPLLFEKGCEDDYDLIWLITADYEIRSKRVMLRDNISSDIISLIMNSQEEEEVKASKSDSVIYNNGSLEDLYTKIDEHLEKVLNNFS